MSLSDQPIVAGITLSTHAETIAAAASALSKRLKTRCIFVHVGEDTEETRVAIVALFERAGVVRPETVVLQAGAADEILLDAAAAQDASLLVIGAREEEGMMQRLHGSVARRVARRAECPVLLLPLHVMQIPSLQNVVVSLRYDEDVAAMLAFVSELLRAEGVRRFTVVQESGFMNRMAARYVDDRDRSDFDEEQRSLLLDFLSVFDLSDFDLQVEILDESAEGIASAEYAAAVGADLLVFQAPTRALTVWDRMLTHPADSVLTTLPCATLLFRARSPKENLE